jgi:hypothetical protein
MAESRVPTYAGRWQAIVSTVVATVVVMGALFGIAWVVQSSYAVGQSNKTEIETLKAQVDEDRRQMSLVCGDLRETEIELNAVQQAVATAQGYDARISGLLWNRSYKEMLPPISANGAAIIQPQQTACK